MTGSIRIGWGNLAYAGFLVCLVPLGIVLEREGSESGTGLMAALLLCAVGSLVYFATSAALTVFAVLRRRAPGKPLAGCVFSLVVLVGILMFVSLP